MPVRVENMQEKTFDGSHSTATSGTSWWTSNEQQMQLSLSKSISFKAESPPQQCHEAKQLGFQLLDQESPSTRSIGQSHSEVVALGANNSHDQFVSSDSGQDGCHGKSGGKMKQVFLLSTPEIAFNTLESDHSHSVTRASYPYPEPFLTGVFTSFGPQALIPTPLDPQMGMTAGRVPLPLDITADGPIYVNAKQYHGILRRRQSRAKLEAQNKLVRTRKPYLHESRHLHALNRVRGSGGRFLSTKKNARTNVSEAVHMQRRSDTLLELESCHSGASNTAYSDITSVSNTNIIFGQQPPDRRFSSHIGSGGSMQSSSQLRASVR